MPVDGQKEYTLGEGAYSAALTKAHFLFSEMRITAALLADGQPSDAAMERIVRENLYQYPTERSLKEVAKYCLSRLAGMGSPELVAALASAPASVAKQVCLYAMAKQSRLVYDFLMTVIAEKYRCLDYSFSSKDVTVFFERLREQDPAVSGWSASTVKKLQGVVTRALVECGFIDTCRSKVLNIVSPAPVLEQVIRAKHEDALLRAFHVFS